MATINQLRIERRAYFQELKRSARSVDSGVEKLQRLVDRVLDRRRDVPESLDWEKAVQELNNLLDLLVALEKIVESGRAIFSILG